MNIALLSHDNKKELMVQFCIAYKGIFEKHNICATDTTGKLVSEASGLKVTRYLSCSQGGHQQISAKIAYNELDMVIFIADPTIEDPSKREEVAEIMRMCDQYSIPFATNIATAEMLVMGLERGDLAWRDIINPKK